MTTIPITEAAARDNIPLGRLYSLSKLERLDDPLIVDKTETGEPVLADDWRLRRVSHKSEAAR